MVEIIDYVIISTILFGIGIYGMVAKRNAIRMIFAIEIIAYAANL
jgi:NADH:ubiquinone oxidoreductase subunit K